MTRTVSRLYDSHGDAQRAVSALEAAGFTSSEVGLVSRYRDDETLAETSSGAASGAAAGAVVGGSTGLLAALGVTRFAATLLYAVNPRDPATFVVVPAVLLAVALLACMLPARAASRLDPVEVLRSE